MTGAAPEAIVVGGGPAGSAAARLLAGWGHTVVVVAAPPSGAPLGESIPPSTAKLFDVLGVRERVDEAGFVRATGNTVWWGGETPRIEFFADGAQGWQVTNHGFSHVLLEHARSGGARVERGRVSAEEAIASGAAFVLDCTGRAGTIARARRLRRYEPGPRTVGIVARWRRSAPFALADPSHTVLESYEGGWAWSVPASPCERFVAVMVDPRRSDLTRSSSAREVYLDQIGRTRRLRGLVADAEPADSPTGWDASMYDAARYVDGNVLLVGDAASFVDPLSSAGIKKALASGWLAAVAVHTCLQRPAMRDAALDFFARREAEAYQSFRRIAARFFAEAAEGHEHPFWSDRADSLGGSEASEASAAAFEELRARPQLAVSRSPDLHFGDRPAVRGNEIVLERRLVTTDDPAGVRYVRGVDVLTLIDLAPGCASVPDAFEAYVRRHGPVPLPDFLAALSTALARRWLAWCDTN